MLQKYPPRKSRLGEAGTCSGRCLDIGCAESGWTAPPPATLSDGTVVRLFKDGQGLSAAYQGIKSAREQICLETYIFHSDPTGRAFAEALSEKARAGVNVFVIYDSFGSIDSDPAMFRSMREAGVHVAEFHPIRPWDCNHSWRPMNRDHRKLLVIDNNYAGLGGLNVGSEYGSGFLRPRARKTELWRDNAVGIAGPGAVMLANCFARTWRYCHRGGLIRTAETLDNVSLGTGGFRAPGFGHEAMESSEFPTPHTRHVKLLSDFGVLASVPAPQSPLVPFMRKLVREARSSLDLTMAYFAPSDVLIGELIRAAKRGVRVRLMLPGRSDIKILRVAAHAFYESLLDAGVHIWERRAAVLHAKTMVIDRNVSILGSTNLDYRSIEFNCELSAVIRNEEFGRHMSALFEHDVEFADQILSETWRERPWRDRLIQWAASRARYLL